MSGEKRSRSLPSRDREGVTQGLPVAKQKPVCVHCVIAKAAFSWLQRVVLTIFMQQCAAFSYFLARYTGWEPVPQKIFYGTSGHEG